jgi:hypothetical protein
MRSLMANIIFQQTILVDGKVRHRWSALTRALESGKQLADAFERAQKSARSLLNQDPHLARTSQRVRGEVLEFYNKVVEDARYVNELASDPRVSAQDVWSIPININVENVDKCNQLGIDPGSCPVANTTANDGAAALSWDGQTMIFYSNRSGGDGGNDLYMSTRKKLAGVE